MFLFQPLMVTLMEDVAAELDALPTFWKLFRMSPLFAVQAQFGPTFSSLYRIVGHGALPNGIQNYKDACYRAYNTPGYSAPKRSKNSFFIACLLVVVPVFAIFWKVFLQ